MKQLSLIAVLIIALLVIAALGGAFYTVEEWQQVIITQFGRPVGDPVTTPGLKVKTPFMQKANFFEKRFLEWDGDPNQVTTKDKRFIWVDTYARWRISDPLLFFQRLTNELGAQSRLDDILNGETRTTIAKHDLIELVRSSNRDFISSTGVAYEESQDEIIYGRAVLQAEVLETAKKRITEADLGIELLDFQVKRINYVEQVRTDVYARMISERQRIASEYRSEGAGEAARILGSKDRDLKEITSIAYRSAQEIKGRADAEAANIYAAAYNRDPDFYRFLKTMEVYTRTMDKNTILLLSTDGEFLKYLKRDR